MPWKALTLEQQQAVIKEAHWRYKWMELNQSQLLNALDGEAYYMRYDADLSEPVRALRPVSLWFGIYLTNLGWRWAEDPTGQIAVVSPDEKFGCQLVELVKTLFDKLDAPDFSRLTDSLAKGEAVNLKGLVVFDSEV